MTCPLTLDAFAGLRRAFGVLYKQPAVMQNGDLSRAFMLKANI